MKTYIARDLFKSLFIAACLTLAGATAFGQGPARATVVNKCTGEVKTKVFNKTPETPRFVGSTNYVRPNRNPNAVWRQGRRVSLLAWNPFKARTPRSWVVGGKRGKRNR